MVQNAPVNTTIPPPPEYTIPPTSEELNDLGSGSKFDESSCEPKCVGNFTVCLNSKCQCDPELNEEYNMVNGKCQNVNFLS